MYDSISCLLISKIFTKSWLYSVNWAKWRGIGENTNSPWLCGIFALVAWSQPTMLIIYQKKEKRKKKILLFLDCSHLKYLSDLPCLKRNWDKPDFFFILWNLDYAATFKVEENILKTTKNKQTTNKKLSVATNDWYSNCKYAQDLKETSIT